jgi:hypothetical protein
MWALALAAILVWEFPEDDAEFRIPKKTVLTIALDQDLEAKKLKKGNGFKARLAEDVTDADRQVLIRAGSEVKGKVEDVDARHLTLDPREIKTPGGKKSIDARVVAVEAEGVRVDDHELESPGRSSARKVGSAGANVGGMVKGGVAGTAIKGIGRILFGGGDKDLKLKKGTRLRIELQKELKFKM